MDRRQLFLDAFLGALGAKEVRYLEIAPEFVSGTVIYDPRDPEERQDFRWTIRDSEAPSQGASELLRFIRANRLLSIDKLIISREDLRNRINSGGDVQYSPAQFSALLEEILQIEVPMLDDGVESDCYFIHE